MSYQELRIQHMPQGGYLISYRQPYEPGDYAEVQAFTQVAAFSRLQEALCWIGNNIASNEVAA